MIYILIYIPLCIIIGYAGSDRKIGFGFAFLSSLLLTPLIGFIITILSPNKAQTEYYENLNKEKRTLEVSNEYDSMTKRSKELDKLQEMRKSGDISNEDYQIMKNKLIG